MYVNTVEKVIFFIVVICITFEAQANEAIEAMTLPADEGIESSEFPFVSIFKL